MSTPCTLNKIEIITVMFGRKYEGPVDADGLERDDAWKLSNEQDKRIYACRNCGEYFHGEDSFDECRTHLGGMADTTSGIDKKLPAW